MVLGESGKFDVYAMSLNNHVSASGCGKVYGQRGISAYLINVYESVLSLGVSLGSASVPASF